MASCIQGQVVTQGRPGLVVYRDKLLQSRFTKTYHTFGNTIDRSWLEVHRQTHYKQIGSLEDEINEMWTKMIF